MVGEKVCLWKCEWLWTWYIVGQHSGISSCLPPSSGQGLSHFCWFALHSRLPDQQDSVDSAFSTPTFGISWDYWYTPTSCLSSYVGSKISSDSSLSRQHSKCFQPLTCKISFICTWIFTFPIAVYSVVSIQMPIFFTI